MTKEKGHATDEQVEKGEVEEKDKTGNDRADEAAASFDSRRNKNCRSLVSRIQNFPIGIKQEETKLREKEESQEPFFLTRRSIRS